MVTIKDKNILKQGLDAILQMRDVSVESESVVLREESVCEIQIKKLVPNQFQPRKEFSIEKLKELAASIEQQGIIQPIIARTVANDTYEIVSGERRYRAAKIAGLRTVPVILRTIDDRVAAAFALVENIQRQDLNIIEEARALKRLYTDFGLTHEEIAKKIGRSRVMVTNIMRLLTLNGFVVGLLECSKLEMGHARALLSLTSEQQIEISKIIVKNSLSVRQTERLVQTNMLDEDPLVELDPKFKEQTEKWKVQVSRLLSSKVNVNVNKRGRGKIVIYFDSQEEAMWLMEHINING